MAITAPDGSEWSDTARKSSDSKRAPQGTYVDSVYKNSRTGERLIIFADDPNTKVVGPDAAVYYPGPDSGTFEYGSLSNAESKARDWMQYDYPPANDKNAVDSALGV